MNKQLKKVKKVKKVKKIEDNFVKNFMDFKMGELKEDNRVLRLRILNLEGQLQACERIIYKTLGVE